MFNFTKAKQGEEENKKKVSPRLGKIKSFSRVFFILFLDKLLQQVEKRRFKIWFSLPMRTINATMLSDLWPFTYVS